MDVAKPVRSLSGFISHRISKGGAKLIFVFLLFQLAVGSLVLLGQTALHALDALSNCRFVP